MALGRKWLRLALGVTWVLGSLARPAFAQPMPGQSNWQSGPGASGDNTYVGTVDVPSSGATLPIDRLATLSGWFVDTTAEGWAGADDIQAFAGAMGSGTSLGHGAVGLPRPGIAAQLNNSFWAAAGWRIDFDPGALPIGQNTLSIYVHTPSKGWWFTQASVNVGTSAGGVAGPQIVGSGPVVTITAPFSGEHVSIRQATYRISGTARDPLGGAKAIDRVQLWLNGERFAEGAFYLGDTGVDGDGQWSLVFQPAAFATISSNLYVYAHSDLTGKDTLAVVHFEISDRPV